MTPKIWLTNPEAHDFPAAVDYLELLMPLTEATALVQQLKKEKTIIKKAKDILRASELPLLPKENMHVTANLKKFKKGKKTIAFAAGTGKWQINHRRWLSPYLRQLLPE